MSAEKKGGNRLFFILFVVLSCIYLGRIFTGGVVLLQGDAFLQDYPLRHFYSEQIKDFSLPLWNPYEFAGLPFIGAMQTGALYPPNILLYGLLPPPYAFNASMILHFAFAGFAVFLYLRLSGLGKFPSVMGGTAFVFCFLSGNRFHTAILNAGVWLPFIIYSLEGLKRSPGLKYSLATGVAIAMQVLAGNFQMCLYTYIVIFFFLGFSFFEVGREKRVRFITLGLTGLSIGIFLALPQLFSVIELSSLSIRPVIHETLGYIFFREFHVYLKTLPSLLFPYLYFSGDYGSALSPPPSAVIAYVGIMPLVVATLVFIRGFKSPFVRLWGTVALVGFILSVADDTPLGQVLFHVPVYNMFRAHGRNLYEVSFAVAMLFSYGVNEMLVSGRHLRSSIATLTTLAVLSIVAIWIGGEVTGIKRILSLTNPAIYIPLFVMLGYIGLLGAYLRFKKRALLYALFIPLFIGTSPFGAFLSSEGRGIKEVLNICEDKGYAYLKGREVDKPFRVALLAGHTTDLNNVPCKVSVLNSYDQMILKDYAYLFDLEPLGFSRYWEHLLKNNTLFSMMNVRYLSVPKDSHIKVPYLEAVETSRGISSSALLFDPSVRRLSPPGDRQRNSFIWRSKFPQGTYLISVRARALTGKGASLRMEVFSDEEWQRRYALNPLHVYPGRIGTDFEEYYRVYHNEIPQGLTMTLISLRFEPVEIIDLSIRELKGYGPPGILTEGKVYEKVGETGDAFLFLNRNALPRVYSVMELIGVKGLGEVKRKLDLNEINPLRQALLYEEDMQELGRSFSMGEVSLRDYADNKAVIDAEFPANGFIVFSDQYYPGWRAFIDGRETKIYRVNGILRGVAVPPGRHEILFKYQPSLLMASMAVSITAFLVLTAMCLWVYLKKRSFI